MKKHSCGLFFQKCAIYPYSKYISFPSNEINQAYTSFLFTFIYVQSTYIAISTAQTDLGLRSRIFSLNLIRVITFSEITQAWQCLKIVFIRSDEFTY